MDLIEARSKRMTGESSRWSFQEGGYPFAVAADGMPIASLSSVCATCQFFFSVADDRIGVSKLITELRDETEHGLQGLTSDVVNRLSPVLPEGTYKACLFAARPRYVVPGSTDDFFENEYRDLWGNQDKVSDPAFGYYRVGELDAKGPFLNSDDPMKVFEFIIPLQQHATLDTDRISYYRRLIRQGHRPTAISIGLFDYRLPVSHTFIAHEHLLNLLVDGHHKIEAAHLEEAEITLLSFIRPIQRATDDYLDELIDAYEGLPTA